MKKINIIAIPILIILSYIILAISCSEQTQKLDNKNLDKVLTIDITIESFYAAISEKKGEFRDWELFKFLFHPDGKIILHRPDKDGNYSTIYYSADEFIKKYRNYIEKVDLHEKTIFSKVSTFGPMSHVLSGYESSEKGVEKPSRGINSFQLLYDSERWWIINAFSSHETPNNPIPSEFFK